MAVMSLTNWLLQEVGVQTILLGLVLALLVKLFISRPKNLPPGPWGVPIFGYLPFLIGKNVEETVTKLGKKYGNIISLNIGNSLIIVLNDYASVKEAFVKQGFNFSGRPKQNTLLMVEDGTQKGFSVAEGDEAAELRRFTLSSFRDFGMGKQSLEPKILDEINHFLEEIGKSEGKPINPRTHLKTSIANVITILEFGRRFEYEDEEFKQFLLLIDSVNADVVFASLYLFLPWLRYLPFTFKLFKRHKLANAWNSLSLFFKEKISNHKKQYVDNSTMDYIDAFITKMKRQEEKTGSQGFFNELTMMGNMMTLFGAGIETTTTTILWCFLFMLKHEEVMMKVQHEIDEVIGRDAEPTILHKPNMPYTEATILEVLRFSSVLPFTLVHGNMEETTLFGHRIPKRSVVIGNIWAINQENWDNPNEFKPERFLNSEGQVVKPEFFIPFSVGKRNCIGETLAHMQIFLYITSFFQKFNIHVPKEEKLSLECVTGITRSPKPFNISVSKR